MAIIGLGFNILIGVNRITKLPKVIKLIIKKNIPDPKPSTLQNSKLETKSNDSPNNLEILLFCLIQFSKPKFGYFIDFSEVL